ncbi:MAG: hypothetical protein AAGG46_04830, partial [Planctomycetota bacterium]
MSPRVSKPSPAERLSTRRQLELMRDLQRLATARAEAEARVAAEHADAIAAANRGAKKAKREADDRHAEERKRLEQRLGAERERLADAYEDERSEAQQQYHGLRGDAESEQQTAQDEALRRSKDEAWEILTLFDAQKGEPQRREAERLAALRGKLAEVQTLRQEASTILTLRRLPLPAAGEGIDATGPTDAEDMALSTAEAANDAAADFDAAGIDDAMSTATSRVAEVRDRATDLYRHPLTKLFEGLTPFGVVAVLAATVYGVAALTIGPAAPAAVGGALATAVVVGAALWFGVRPLTTKRAHTLFDAVGAAAREAESAIQSAVAAARSCRRDEATRLIEQRNTDLASLGFEIEQTLGETRLRVLEKLDSASELFPAKLAELRSASQAAIADVDERLTTGLTELTAKHSAYTEEIERRRVAEHNSADEQRDAAWRSLAEAWLSGYSAVQQEAAAMRAACDNRFPDWSAAGSRPDAQSPASPAMAVEFGRATVDLARLRSGLSDDPRLRPDATTIELPTLVTLDDQPSLVLSASGGGKQAAVGVLRSMALRWLVGQPAGKVRLTVLDPTGLGEGFASLMHLADYDENLIAGRIWSEARDIDEQLLRLTTHLETVIQKYLRSEYESIHAYNAQAGEVAEPFQVLVVNGFPTNFSDGACKRLMNLMTSGPRCGVYVMLAVDRDLKPPAAFRLDDVLPTAVHLDWEPPGQHAAGGGGRFVWRYPAFERLPLAV